MNPGDHRTSRVRPTILCCPFCLGTAVEVTGGHPFACVECTDCLCSGPPVGPYTDDPNKERQLEKAIRLWNACELRQQLEHALQRARRGTQ